MPIVFVDAPRGTYWKTWQRYVEEHILRAGLISLLTVALLCGLNAGWREARTGGRVEIELSVWGMPFENALYVWPNPRNMAIAPLEDLHRKQGDGGALQALQARVERLKRPRP